MPRTNKKLTEKQAKAAHALVAGATKTDAYRSAYNVAKESTVVGRRAWELFQLPHVAAYVEELTARAADRACLKREEAIAILASVARGELARYLRPDGTFDLAAISKARSDLEAVQLADTEAGQRISVKLRDPIRAIEVLAKMNGWNEPEKHDLGGVVFNLHMDGEKDGAK
jgi:phage terminase small subunit